MKELSGRTVDGSFLDRWSKNTQIPNFIKTRVVVAELFHTERRTERPTDMTKLIVAFRNFANALKMQRYYNLKLVVLKLWRVKSDQMLSNIL